MNVSKLYRKQMAELANITPTQLDYFVKLGAFAPDLGETRKHFSTFEASFVLVAGQLSPFLKDQKSVVEVLRALRNKVSDGNSGLRSMRDYWQQVIIGAAIGEVLEQEEFHQENFRGQPEFKFSFHLELRFAALSLGFDPKSFHSASTQMSLHPILSEVPKSLSEFCADVRRDLNDLAYSQMQNYRRSFDENEYSGIMIQSFFDHLSWGGNGLFLNVALNQDGTCEIALECEPEKMSNRISWMTFNLGHLFQRFELFRPIEGCLRAPKFPENFYDVETLRGERKIPNDADLFEELSKLQRKL